MKHASQCMWSCVELPFCGHQVDCQQLRACHRKGPVTHADLGHVLGAASSTRAPRPTDRRSTSSGQQELRRLLRQALACGAAGAAGRRGEAERRGRQPVQRRTSRDHRSKRPHARDAKRRSSRGHEVVAGGAGTSLHTFGSLTSTDCSQEHFLEYGACLSSIDPGQPLSAASRE
jgi:hypothetical protein